MKTLRSILARLGLLTWLFLAHPIVAQDLVISEFMAINTSTLRDNYGEYSDWIEIHNPGPFTRSLAGWFLTDDAFNRTRWPFPEREIEPDGYLVVFASGRNETNAASALHTNFQLKDVGEYLALVGPDRQVVSQFSPVYPRQRPNISYGRDRADPTFSGYFEIPTPGAPNQVAGLGIAPEVEFSRRDGTFPVSQPFPLALTTSDSQATIFYSFGTNVPGTNAFRYGGPILITNTTVVRARAFMPDRVPGPISSRSFIGLTGQTNVLGFNSRLPIVVVHNHGQGTFPADQSAAGQRWVSVQTFENPPGGEPNSLTNPPTASALGVMGIHGADTLLSSASHASFHLELRDDYGRPRALSLLGLPPESDWVLHAPTIFEPALFHDALAMQLARDGGEAAPRVRFFELYLKDDLGVPGPIASTGFAGSNGDYQGVYVLIEKIKQGASRVNIAKLEPNDLSPPNVTGGYLFRIDRTDPGEGTFSAGGAALIPDEPRWRDWTNAARAPQRAYLQGYLNQFAAGLSGFNRTNATLPSGLPNTNHYSHYIDPESWVRRHQHEVVMFNVEALRLGAYFFKDRDRRIEAGPGWDFDRAQGSTDGRDANPRLWRSSFGDLGTDFFNFSPWWKDLFQAPDFWQAWIDRYQQERAPGGSWSTTNVFARIDQLFDELKEAQPRERERWGLGTRGTNGFGAGSYADEVTWKKHWFNARLDFIDTNFLAMPIVRSIAHASEIGGSVFLAPPSPPGSRVYYTTDGTDPRLPNGEHSPTAQFTDRAVTLELSVNTRITARSYNASHRNLTGPNHPPLSSPWSGPRAVTVTNLITPLRLTEIMYHPLAPLEGGAPAEDFQFLEFQNTGSAPFAMTGLRLTSGVQFEFPDGTLAPGDYLIVVRNRAAFETRYGPGRPVAGEFTGTLSFGGETVAVTDGTGTVILRVGYSDRWHDLTDGPGLSLVATATGTNAIPPNASRRSAWRPSRWLHGSPGVPEPEVEPWARVVINEVLANSAAPYEDYVELFNPSPDVADLSHWYLTDDSDQPRKFQFPPGTLIGGQDYLAVDEHAFNARGAAAGTGFAFDAAGDAVFLYSANSAGELTGYVHGFRFGGSGTNEPFGRTAVAGGIEEFARLTDATPGRPNAGSSARPVGPQAMLAITEIMFDPPDFRLGAVTTTNLGPETEYLEIKNIGSEPVQLGGAALTAGIDFEFPPYVLGAGAYALVVRNRSVFAERYDAQRPVVGEYAGGLSADGERLTLISAAGEPLLDFAYDGRWYFPTRGQGRSLVLTNEATPPGQYSSPFSWRAGSRFGGTPGMPEATPEPLPLQFPIVISEIHYRPPDFFVRGAWVSNTVDEFIELLNLSSSPVHLSAAGFLSNPWRIGGDVEFTFPSDLRLPSFGACVIVPFDPANGADLSRFRAVHQVPEWVRVVGPWTGSLRAPGTVRLDGILDTFRVSGLDQVDYDAAAPWPDAADGLGYSLHRILSPVSVSEPRFWRASVPSPGLPYAPSSQPPTIVEQPTDTRGIVGGAAEFRVSATGGPDLEYRWFFEDHLIPGATNAFLRLERLQLAQAGRYRAFVNSGGDIVGSDVARLEVKIAVSIVTQPRPVSVRIQPDPQAAPTTNATFEVAAVTDYPPLGYQWRFNGRPIAGATERTFTIPDVQTTHYGTYSCVLTDQAGTLVSDEAWLYPIIRVAVVQSAPTAMTVAPGTLVGLSCVITGFPPPFSFQWRRGSTPLTNIISSNAVSLFSFPATNRPFVTNQYRVVVTNLFSGASPGSAGPFIPVTTGLDTDGDGLLDDVELGIPGLDPVVASDAANDGDGDGVSDRDELHAGTDPRDPLSVLRVESVLVAEANGGTRLSLQFLARSNRVYTVEAREALGAGAWRAIVPIPATTTHRWVTVDDPAVGTGRQRVYRVVTPQ